MKVGSYVTDYLLIVAGFLTNTAAFLERLSVECKKDSSSDKKEKSPKKENSSEENANEETLSGEEDTSSDDFDLLETDEGTKITKEMISDVLREAMKKHGKEEIVKLLNKFKVKQLSDIEDKDLSKLYEQANKLKNKKK